MSSRQSLSGYDALFASDSRPITITAEKAVEAGLTVQEIPLADLHEFTNHPFKVLQNVELDSLTASIQENGIMEPLLVRPRQDGGYEILSGHRRTQAAKQAGLKTAPAIVMDLDDAAATITMVDANQKRARYLPSELAFAFKMRMNAARHQGQTLGNFAQRSAEQIGLNFGVSERNVKNYIRLTNLIPELLDKVDEKKLQLGAAVELSFLKPDMQALIMEAYYETDRFPKKPQAKRIREKGVFNLSWLVNIAMPEDPTHGKLSLDNYQLQSYFPADYSNQEKEAVIMELLEKWHQEQEEKKIIHI